MPAPPTTRVNHHRLNSPEFNGELYFQNDDGNSGRELWQVKADGSVAQVADIEPGADWSQPRGFTTFADELYFSAYTSGHGDQIWKVSADGSVIVVDVNADNLQVAPRGFTEFGGEFYFSASDQLGSNSSDEELWKVAADGHVSLVDRNVRISNPLGFTPFTTDVRPNSPPTAADDTATTAEDTAVTAYVLRNDLDTDGNSLSLAITSGPSNGTAAVNADGSISYSPNGNLNGADSLAYSVSDGHGGVDAAVLGLMVTAINDVPVAEDDGVATAEDTRFSIAIAAILSNDVDVDSDGLSIQSVASGVNGTVVLTGSNLVFTPNANANGSGSFTYTVTVATAEPIRRLCRLPSPPSTTLPLRRAMRPGSAQVPSRRSTSSATIATLTVRSTQRPLRSSRHPAMASQSSTRAVR